MVFNLIHIECCVISISTTEFISHRKCCSYMVHVRFKFLPFFSRRNLDYFQNFHLSSMTSVDADTGNGEVTIRLPPETYPIISGITELSNILSFLFLASKEGRMFEIMGDCGYVPCLT